MQTTAAATEDTIQDGNGGGQVLTFATAGTKCYHPATAAATTAS